MASATVLLLLLASSLLMGSKPVEGARFDYTLCKERHCFVNSGCSTITGTELLPISGDWSADLYKQYRLNYMPYTERMSSCKILLAIWPYSRNKWLVSYEANMATDIVSFRIIDKASHEKYSGVSCSRSNGVFAVITKLSTYKTEFVRGSHATDHFTCEFFFETTNDYVLPDLGMYDKIELTYGNVRADAQTIEQDLFIIELKSKTLCNPDRIKFDQALAKPGQHIVPVNSDRFALICPQDYDLMYDDGAKIHKVSMIKCGPSDEQDKRGDVVHRYHITPLYGVGDVVSIAYDQEFKAHCAPPCHSCTCPRA